MDRKLAKIERDRLDGKVREQYKGVRTIRNAHKPEKMVVKDKEGNLLVKEDEVLKRWEEYYRELLNKGEPEVPVDEYDAVMNVMREPSDDDVRRAIKSLKNNKAAGVDGIRGEMINPFMPVVSYTILSGKGYIAETT